MVFAHLDPAQTFDATDIENILIRQHVAARRIVISGAGEHGPAPFRQRLQRRLQGHRPPILRHGVH